MSRGLLWVLFALVLAGIALSVLVLVREARRFMRAAEADDAPVTPMEAVRAVVAERMHLPAPTPPGDEHGAPRRRPAGLGSQLVSASTTPSRSGLGVTTPPAVEPSRPALGRPAGR